MAGGGFSGELVVRRVGAPDKFACRWAEHVWGKVRGACGGRFVRLPGWSSLMAKRACLALHQLLRSGQQLRRSVPLESCANHPCALPPCPPAACGSQIATMASQTRLRSTGQRASRWARRGAAAAACAYLPPCNPTVSTPAAGRECSRPCGAMLSCHAMVACCTLSSRAGGPSHPPAVPPPPPQVRVMCSNNDETVRAFDAETFQLVRCGRLLARRGCMLPPGPLPPGWRLHPALF